MTSSVLFTIDQIKACHAKVKSGSDFPAYIQELITLGLARYTNYVSDGHTVYTGAAQRADGTPFELTSTAKYETKAIAATGNKQQLQKDLKAHQAGQSDYLTFCTQAAAAGVDRWVVDMQPMTCTFFDVNDNELIVETIPEA